MVVGLIDFPDELLDLGLSNLLTLLLTASLIRSLSMATKRVCILSMLWPNWSKFRYCSLRFILLCWSLAGWTCLEVIFLTTLVAIATKEIQPTGRKNTSTSIPKNTNTYKGTWFIKMIFYFTHVCNWSNSARSIHWWIPYVVSQAFYLGQNPILDLKSSFDKQI